jgi:hypothetical protein
METNNHQKPFAASLIDEMTAEVAAGIGRSGAIRCDPEELSALREAAKACIYARAMPSFNPNTIASDREIVEALNLAKERTARLIAKRDVLDTRLTNAREQTARMPAPSRSLAGIVATAIGVFTVCFAPTLYSAFLSGMEDALLAWVISIILGVAMGGFLTLLLLNFEEEQRQ